MRIADIFENASAGATSSSSVATVVGGIGAGFDPNGDHGVYSKRKKPVVLRRTLREYKEVIDTSEYGGWISPKGEVFHVGRFGHDDEAEKHGFKTTWDAVSAGYVRFLNKPSADGSLGTFAVEGFLDAIRATFRVWWPTAMRAEKLIMQIDDDHPDRYFWSRVIDVRENRNKIVGMFGPASRQVTEAKLKVGDAKSFVADLETGRGRIADVMARNPWLRDACVKAIRDKFGDRFTVFRAITTTGDLHADKVASTTLDPEVAVTILMGAPGLVGTKDGMVRTKKTMLRYEIGPEQVVCWVPFALKTIRAVLAKSMNRSIEDRFGTPVKIASVLRQYAELNEQEVIADLSGVTPTVLSLDNTQVYKADQYLSGRLISDDALFDRCREFFSRSSVVQEAKGEAQWSGCWILPSGDIRKCNHSKGYHHGDIAAKILGLSLGNDEDDGLIAYNEALKDGWVRLATFGYTFVVQFTDKPTPAASTALFSVLQKHGPTYFRFETEIGNKYKTFEDYADLLNYLRRILR